MAQTAKLKKEKTRNREIDRTPRKPYHKPKLEKLGDLRTLTLGVSGAPTDFSGGQINQQTP